MFDELEKYDEHDHFFLKPESDLRNVCNAPTNKSGVYIVYALKKGKIELVYIGRSGKLNADGSMKHRLTGLGGIKDRIVNGHHLGKIPARKSWINEMKKEGIEFLDVYWYITHTDEYSDCPSVLKKQLLQIHYAIYERLPKWNKE
jgi:hypothetical protein